MQKFSLLCYRLYPKRLLSEANQCSRRKNAGFWDGSGPARIAVRVDTFTSPTRVISVFISILNKGEERSLRSLLFEVKNVTSYQQHRLLNWTRRLWTSWKRSASWRWSRGPSQGPAWIKSRLTKSHRNGERAARYLRRCSTVQSEGSGMRLVCKPPAWGVRISYLELTYPGRDECKNTRMRDGLVLWWGPSLSWLGPLMWKLSRVTHTWAGGSTQLVILGETLGQTLGLHGQHSREYHCCLFILLTAV